MDKETRALARVLAERDALRLQLAANDRELRDALRAWSDRSGRGGEASEATARSTLRRAGVAA